MNKVNWKVLPETPYIPLSETARKVGAEGSVLLENKGDILPVKKGQIISLFGRTQIDYNKSGTGSGGLVNAPYVINILDGILENKDLTLNMELVDTYKKWLIENPFDKGTGWATEPWCQVEMVPSEETVKRAKEVSDIAVMVIGRTAGEDKDNGAEKGSWYLTDNEEAMLSVVSKYFEKTVVLLNTGAIIDTSWVEKYDIKSVMYVWHGGQEGGRAVADLLSGKVTPSGKLPDTIAKDINDYPSTKNFGDKIKNYFKEDIYVGYRYFETFAKDSVLYPFGFGLSYTKFDTKVTSVNETDGKILIDVEVKNVGNYQGKEVVQVYFDAPQGKLGKSVRTLIAFAKTKLLASGETEKLSLKILVNNMSSFDDSGVTGNKNCYVLEQGDYNIYVGNSVRNTENVYTHNISELVVVKKCVEALAPRESFEIMYPEKTEDGYKVAYKDVTVRTVDYNERIKAEMPQELGFTGDKGIKLNDVKEGRATLDDFVAQLSNEALTYIVQGEGMCSPKVRPGSTGAIGGLTKELRSYGVPPITVHDGPSGIRMDSGEEATSLPNGAATASTWDVQLITELGENLSIELCTHHIDSILGPGINIHRNPLNGRNFEYFSEDPVLTGEIAAAYIKGVDNYDNSATVKHFFANSQEWGRHGGDSVMSQRAAREIYLKAFEIAIKKGNASSVMSAYNRANGLMTVHDYELNTVILRDEWGYTGFVMSDWWPRIADEKTEELNLKDMVIAQNDVYMLTTDALTSNNNLLKSVEDGTLTRGQLQRNAKNILRYIMKSNCFTRFVADGCRVMDSFVDRYNELKTVGFIEKPIAEEGYTVDFAGGNEYIICVDFNSYEPEYVQIRIGITFEDGKVDGLSVNGTKTVDKKVYHGINVKPGVHKITFTFPKEKININSIEIRG